LQSMGDSNRGGNGDEYDCAISSELPNMHTHLMQQTTQIKQKFDHPREDRSKSAELSGDLRGWSNFSPAVGHQQHYNSEGGGRCTIINKRRENVATLWSSLFATLRPHRVATFSLRLSIIVHLPLPRYYSVVDGPMQLICVCCIRCESIVGVIICFQGPIILIAIPSSIRIAHCKLCWLSPPQYHLSSVYG